MKILLDSGEPAFRLLYTSRAKLRGNETSIEHQITRIISQSFLANLKSGSTGVLFYSGGYFVQLLDGPRDSLIHTYERIASDSRHSELTLLYQGENTTKFRAECPMNCAGIYFNHSDSDRKFCDNKTLSDQALRANDAMDLLLSHAPYPDNPSLTEKQKWRSWHFWRRK